MALPRFWTDQCRRDTAPIRLVLGEDTCQLWESAVASRNRDLAQWRTNGENTAVPGAVKILCRQF